MQLVEKSLQVELSEDDCSGVGAQANPPWTIDSPVASKTIRRVAPVAKVRISTAPFATYAISPGNSVGDGPLPSSLPHDARDREPRRTARRRSERTDMGNLQLGLRKVTAGYDPRLEAHRLASQASSQARSSGSNTRERVMKRTPSGASNENPEPHPGTTSIRSWVCFQASYCCPPI